jgi:hypothetical protein
MKPRKFKQKLSLNRKTIANLNNGELGHVKGGIKPTNYFMSCPTFCTCPITPNACGIG